MGPKPKYSIIVVTFNALEHTVRCVESVFKHTKDFELILVDNASNDGTRGYLMALKVTRDNVKVILNDENKNFGPGNNQGYEAADGQYIVLLNSDTAVTPGWLDRMQRVMDTEERCAMVGPVSGSSAGRQYVGRLETGLWDLDNKAIQRANQFAGQHEETGMLFGWCILASRDFLKDEPYLFDERFTNSFEDNDLCLRARLKGWRLFIDWSTYIHHHGQGSFTRAWGSEFLNLYSENGKKNQSLFYEKWKAKPEQKLVAVYRIANCERFIRESLERTSEFADEIICLLARSKDSTEAIARSFKKVRVVEVWNEPEHPFDEQAERDWLLQKAIERGADWVISIDGDEVYEPKFVGMVQALMRNPNPQVFGYWCNWRTIWDKDDEGNDLFRADGIFGGFQNYRFFRVLPGMRIKENSNVYNHHCGSAPFIPMENLKWLNVRVKHLGYDTEEQRRKKHAFYKAADPHPVVRDVGNADYHHLVDKNVSLKRYNESARLTVMSVVRNEEEYIYRMMENVEPVADEYVIVDAGCEDGTLAEIERFRKNHVKPVRVVKAEGFDLDENGFLLNYAQAKNFGKLHCTTDWILQMDADEIFEGQLVGAIFGFMEESCDAFLFNAINYLEPAKSNRPEDNKFSVSESVRMYRNLDELFYSGLVHESLEDTCSARVRNGGAQMVMSPIHIHHHGYLRNKNRVREKVDRYFKINARQLEVSGGEDPRPLFNMALHYFNDGDEAKMRECYEKALKLDPTFWRPKQNMAFWHLDKAKAFLNETMKQMPALYRENSKVSELSQTLNKFEFMPMKVG